jgi:hypothetical protein
VKNNEDKGAYFIPQNTLKVIVAGKEIDCADLEGTGESYTDNLEPTLSGHRRGYFEVPKALLTNPFVIRFSEVREKIFDLTVDVASKTFVEKSSDHKEDLAPATSVATPATATEGRTPSSVASPATVTEKAIIIPVTEEQRAAWKRFADEDKKERELLKQQEAKRRADYEAEAKRRGPDLVIGAKPAPQ